MKIASVLVFAVLVVLPAAAVAQDAMKGMDIPSGKAMMQANQTMMKAMSGMQPTGDPDVDFVMMMIPHHQAAVDMAEVELKYGRDKQLRALADMIVVSQRKEITTMKKWLSDHGH